MVKLKLGFISCEPSFPFAPKTQKENLAFKSFQF